jgi:hypothetical protein
MIGVKDKQFYSKIHIQKRSEAPEGGFCIRTSPADHGIRAGYLSAGISSMACLEASSSDFPAIMSSIMRSICFWVMFSAISTSLHTLKIAYKQLSLCYCFGFNYHKKTERQGFEPWVPDGTTVFETAPFNRSGTSPWIFFFLHVYSYIYSTTVRPASVCKAHGIVYAYGSQSGRAAGLTLPSGPS